ncbi:MAG TPA: glutamine--fructose-6-phosphate transaminase (isomerizing), partial [Porphyromonadaceae bacterium]|nr:glutamine--fructose-6-phosphate transaminase (isomerizing) [Porphyromonadaceae bacterium]
MCGIVGYIGFREAYPVLIKGLHRLEYRGYDSAGVALINQRNNLSVYKSKGRVQDLEEYVQDKDTSGTIGIAHTRWATHGEPSNANAHPHYSQSESLALIHNGIIENYAVLKAQLIANGYTFHSSTDTEVLVQWIEYIRQLNGYDLLTAVQIALSQVVGAYAIALLEKGNPDQIIAARKSSPLVVGVGKGEFFLASDASPIIEYTNKVIYLDDEEIAVIRRDQEPKIITLTNVRKPLHIKELEMNLSELERGGYPHFMLKEIFEQPETLKNCMSGRINVEATNVTLSGIIDHKDKFIQAKRIIIVACGTSWHAGLIGKYLFEEFCRIPVEVEYASEFRYRHPVIHPEDIVIAISQSGETADSLAAIELARHAGAFVYGICNVVGSSIPRNTHSGSYTHCGHEIGVASTKAFTAQITVLTMMALAIGKEKGTISVEKYLAVIKELSHIPEKIERVLALNKSIKKLSRIFTYARNFIYLGRGYNYPIALEGALKLKEISYIH